jgi:hypothetical protein
VPPGRATNSEQRTEKELRAWVSGKEKGEKRKRKREKKRREKKKERRKIKNELSIFRNCNFQFILTILLLNNKNKI